MKKNISLAFSSCPNDTFMFHAAVHGLVDTEGLCFDIEIHDVEELNKRAQLGRHDVSKLSFHGLFAVRGVYESISSGAALGWDCGPLLVCRAEEENCIRALLETPRSSGLRVAVPGEYTTGALLCALAYPFLCEQVPMLFSDIETAVMNGEAGLGVLIHEGRFTFRDKGLALVRDLGSWWQQSSGCPVPLGCIAVRSSFGPDFAATMARVLRRSIEYAFAHPEASEEYVASYAREMSAEIQRKHISLFVNRFSLDLGEEGRRAVDALYERYEGSYLCRRREEILPDGRKHGKGS